MINWLLNIVSKGTHNGNEYWYNEQHSQFMNTRISRRRYNSFISTICLLYKCLHSLSSVQCVLSNKSSLNSISRFPFSITFPFETTGKLVVGIGQPLVDANGIIDLIYLSSIEKYIHTECSWKTQTLLGIFVPSNGRAAYSVRISSERSQRQILSYLKGKEEGRRKYNK